MNEIEKIKKVWNERAKLGDISGSNDFILKEIEKKEILKFIPANSRIIELGCGNGRSLIDFCSEKKCEGLGFDYSEQMIELANYNLEHSSENLNISFDILNVLDLSISDEFDLAITQRCLGNLPEREQQNKAILNILRSLKKGGKFLMLEDCKDHHDNLNKLRSSFDLYEIEQPWFNNFLEIDQVDKLQDNHFKISVNPYPVASTYYLLSRVIYAHTESLKGTEPDELKYDSEINKMALKIPNFGNLGAPTLWQWEKL
jgi:SAM-dependent methyltransferase